ncbi:MAG: Protein of unknown function (DUF1501) [Burkholderiaceae bacterium]|jgi:uncharacterized protein (DUF1501 family)|nr:MAG: Protein of unknown function (DUF1501) [Burkholderiaceae bacterium]
MKRRHLLQSMASIPLAVGSARLFAAPAAGSRFLLVFLRGAYDCCSLLVPTASSFYYESRPDIAIARPGADANAALPLDADWGLHPVLRETILPLYQRRELAFVAFAGTDDTTRSHFETQDTIEMGQPLSGTRNYHSGFLNRLAGVVNGAAPMAFTAQIPLSLQGRVQVPNMALRAVGRSNIDPRQSRLIASMYQGNALASRVDEGFTVRDQVMRDLESEMQASGRNAVSARGFGAEAHRIARLMADPYNIGFVDVGGWDTHVNQGGAQGYLANRLSELGQGLAAFAQEAGPAWRNTTVVVVSEFGRTFRQNGNHGTDHGHGTVYWVLGGGVRGGRIAGEQQRIEQATLFQNRDLPVLNEYRAVLAGLFRRQFGLTDAQLGQVFAGVTPRDIGLI